MNAQHTTQPTTRSQGSAAAVAVAGHALQLRDVEILRAVSELRVLRTDQISRLLFPTRSGGTSSHCRARLRFLEHAKLLTREHQLQAPTDGRKPHVFRITPAGIRLLIQEIGLEGDEGRLRRRSRRLSPLFLAHQLELNEVYVRFATCAPASGWIVEQWLDDFDLKETHTSTFPVSDGQEDVEVGIVPDSYLALRPGPLGPLLHFFVELDRGTMALRSRKRLGHSFQRRIRAYNAYFRSQEILDVYGTRRIRVLTVTTGAERLKNMKRAVEDAGGRSRYWFATQAQVGQLHPLDDPFWLRASTTNPVALRHDSLS